MRNLKDLFHRLRLGWVWVALQFVLTLILILVGLAWTRLPDKHIWQVALSLLVPLILIICALELQAGTVRKLADDDGKRVKLVWGAITLLVWIAVGAAMWALLDWFDDQIPLLAGYLNSKSSAHARATMFTYEHIQRWLTGFEWVIRWIIVPAKLIPYAAASTQWGWRLPWRRVIKFLFNLRWWLGVVIAALLGVWLPSHFFNTMPKGSVAAQEWAVIWKLIATYVLAVGSWVLLLSWWATLFSKHLSTPPTEEVLVPAPVLAGPPNRSLRARAEVPPPDDTPA
ncbi:MAG: hypothetical protein ABSG96_14335 [Terracidiphilus sp.]